MVVLEKIPSVEARVVWYIHRVVYNILKLIFAISDVTCTQYNKQYI